MNKEKFFQFFIAMKKIRILWILGRKEWIWNITIRRSVNFIDCKNNLQFHPQCQSSHILIRGNQMRLRKKIQLIRSERGKKNFN
jgi:hypothetical protein